MREIGVPAYLAGSRNEIKNYPIQTNTYSYTILIDKIYRYYSILTKTKN